MRALLAAGGTGGHMFPAQSLSEELARMSWDCAMVTDVRGRRHTGRIKADPIIEVQAASISPHRPIKALQGAIKLTRGIRQANAFMRDWKPDVVIGFGGYPSFPALRAAERLGIPRIVHEQNAVLGRVNRVFTEKATAVASGFEDLAKLPQGARHIVVGNPLRDAILNAKATQLATPAQDGNLNLFIVGGSLGAAIISDVVPKAIASLPSELRSKLRVTQQTTVSHLEIATAIYEAANVPAKLDTFFGDIELHLAHADVIIARAGASSISEIALMGKPSILVPLAIAMDDHQTANAQALKRLGAAVILPESEFDVQSLSELLAERLNDTDWLDQAGRSAAKLARPDAARDLAALVVSAAG